MQFTLLLLSVAVNTVLPYYIYNPSSHTLTKRTSLEDIPEGCRLIAPPRNRKRRSRLTRGDTTTYCTDGGFTCDAPYDKASTFQFECTQDSQCPSTYKCCSQKCFLHKICVRAYSPPNKDDNTDNCDNQRPGQCEQWPYTCQVPYDYSYTRMFKCTCDNQCPKKYKCCKQSCFTHRICSRIITNIGVTPVKTVISGNDYSEEGEGSNTTTEIISTTDKAVQEETAEEEALTSTITSTSTTSTTTESYYEESESTTENEEEYDAEGENEDYDNGNDYEEVEHQTENKDTTITDVIATNTSVIDTVETLDIKKENDTVPELKARKRPPVVYVSRRTTPDSNSINPDYAAYYYNYDNNTVSEDGIYDEDEDYNYDDGDEF